ncbi:MAG: cyclic nucleotide-binding domain-containing protein [Myxococcales bacterium]|nr:cyclic nucleotide-binding domain-containing protein [Myxococcales bacterium]MCB9642060.1 cyclic nucleotide-binding domain-containing protein [Myxococcales bacterium]
MERVICAYCKNEVPRAAACGQCGAPLMQSARLLVGEMIHSYRLEEQLAEGATGRIFRAIHVATGQEVALKLLQPELAAQPQAIRRFRREAEAGLRLQHPRAVKLYEFGIASGLGIFLVMELIRGVTLRERLVREGSITPKAALQIALQLCDALEKAHEMGIIHRDLKPANVMLQDHPSQKIMVKVCDFGTARIEMKHNEFDTQLTIPGMVCGTPGYMAPEQLTQNQEVGPYTDIYAIGVLLFEMLTGQLPFLGDSPQELLMNPLFHSPRPLVVTAPSLANYPHHARIEQLIHNCLSRDIGQRPHSIGFLRMGLLSSLPTPSIELSLHALESMDTLDDTGRSLSFADYKSEESPIPEPPSAYPWHPILLKDEELQEIRNAVQQAPVQTCLPAQPIFSAKDSSQSFFMVKDGEVRLVYHEEERLVEVDRLGPDGFLGVPSFFSNALSSLTAEATRHSQVYRVDQKKLAQWVQGNAHLYELFRRFHREYILQEAIRYSPFFATVPPDERASLVQKFSFVPYGRGKEIVTQGDILDCFYLVASGRVEVYRLPSGGGSADIIRYLRAGQFIGEISLLYKEPATASVRAASNTVLLQISRSDLLQELKPYPKLFNFLHQIAQQRIDENRRADQRANLTLVEETPWFSGM